MLRNVSQTFKSPRTKRTHIALMSLSSKNLMMAKQLSLFCLAALSALCLLSGCASYGVIKNLPSQGLAKTDQYDLDYFAKSKPSGNMVFIVSFSGGGSRAAAMAYGVLQELRDTKLSMNGREKSLLDEVDKISSVSGGSFTSAYYGVYGDKIFENFEEDFLRANIQKRLLKSLANPTHWFGPTGRTERTIRYYDKTLFRGATFADMMKPGRPMIIINASDLGEGVRFSFIQEYFDLLAADLTSFPVARAVAASSAVPVLFNPVVVENYPGGEFKWPANTADRVRKNAQFADLYEGLNSYKDSENRKFIHFVDGGITDNTGLRAISDIVALSGDASAIISSENGQRPTRIVHLSVNASVKGKTELDESRKQPSILTAMNAVSAVELHRYNADTLDLAKDDLNRWANALSLPGRKVTPYFIQVSFQEVEEPQLKVFLNKIPTSFDLTDEQVDVLIKSARGLLRADPQFQKLVADLNR